MLLGYVLTSFLMLQSASYQEPDVEQYVIEQFSTADGLGESLVTDVVRDSTGYLWIAHQSGVTRYDGYTFKNYAHGDYSNIKGRNIRRLHVDKNQTLWAISDVGYINKYDQDLQDFVPQPMAPESLRDHDWYSFIEHSPDTVLLQFVDQPTYESLKLLYFNPSIQEYGHMHLPITEEDQRYLDNQIKPEDSVLYFYDTTDDGTEWLGITDAVLRKAPTDTVFQVVRTADPPNDLRGARKIFFEGDSLAWFSSVDRGMLLYNRHEESLHEYRFNPPEEGWVNHFIPDATKSPKKPNQFWLGTRVSSLVYFDTNSRTFVEIEDKYNRLPSDIMRVYVDEQDILWAGTKGGGLTKINPLTRKSRRLLTTESIKGDEIALQILHMRAIDDSTFFVSTYENGYYLMDHLGNVLFHNNEVAEGHLPHISVWSGWDGADTFWASTSYRLASFDKNVYDHENAEWEWYPVQQQDTITGPAPDLMRTLAGDKKGRVWVGSRNGLHEYSSLNDRWTTYHSDSNIENSFAEDFIISTYFDDRQNRLWVGHNTKGVSVIEWIGGKPVISRLFPDEQVDQLLQIYGFEKIEGGRTLALTDQGVFEIDEKLRTMIPAAEFSHLKGERVNSIYKDSKNRWWAGTNQGIVISDHTGRVIRLDERDGMFNREISYSLLKSNTGELWVSTYNGIVAFETDSLTIPSNGYDINVVSFEVLGSEKTFKPDRDMMLNYDENNFKLSVSNFDLRDPESQKWFFRLNGYSDQWLPATDQNIMQFTNLGPGDYQMDVRVESKYGYTQVASSLLSITIDPAFWQTTLFETFVAILFLGIAGGYIYQRYKHLSDIRKERNRIMGDLHDDLASVLASINFNINTLKPGQNLGNDKFEQL
ncbi:ligand-binding sensor domain-containing protein [Rhodohalobacter sp. 8-1]|uniref:ligand-binding sensor domain-containing protein n=1 Tax=Rhodohalobacter sp. 8-1 TaxID=3131972 RepID=UPI0030EF069F